MQSPRRGQEYVHDRTHKGNRPAQQRGSKLVLSSTEYSQGCQAAKLWMYAPTGQNTSTWMLSISSQTPRRPLRHGRGQMESLRCRPCCLCALFPECVSSQGRSCRILDSPMLAWRAGVPASCKLLPNATASISPPPRRPLAWTGGYARRSKKRQIAASGMISSR